MHNNIMAAGSRDRPPMLATGRYAQWRSRFLRYIDTRPNGDALRKCILKGPYTPTPTDCSQTPKNKRFHLIILELDDDIYSNVMHVRQLKKSGGKPSKATTRSHATTRYKGKEIAKPITPPSESASEEDSDPEQAQRDKDMQKNLALIAKSLSRKSTKPTNTSLRTS
ncbi:hypothetical protein Tco_1102611 [Tanacetum coccineum]